MEGSALMIKEPIKLHPKQLEILKNPHIRRVISVSPRDGRNLAQRWWMYLYNLRTKHD